MTLAARYRSLLDIALIVLATAVAFHNVFGNAFHLDDFTALDRRPLRGGVQAISTVPEADGPELLRRIRALGAEGGGKIPAIALTAFARSEDRTRALRAGFAAHVSKPVDPAELVATVASVAGRVTGPS